MLDRRAGLPAASLASERGCAPLGCRSGGVPYVGQRDRRRTPGRVALASPPLPSSPQARNVLKRSRDKVGATNGGANAAQAVSIGRCVVNVSGQAVWDVLLRGGPRALPREREGERKNRARRKANLPARPELSLRDVRLPRRSRRRAQHTHSGARGGLKECWASFFCRYGAS
ncbi:hypothetical protein BDY21DRAFT_176939 [Lineolata rhizophorae]|uniref:Uncharacterized protein n=1 Tax=Lineolata rhizophorae TaxID=578093 RepID=A0A6A6P7J8_9PEZI|nr:hypothetical protein BDY21DRAFT_176939 [Lineolata rhizophorae]